MDDIQNNCIFRNQQKISTVFRIRLKNVPTWVTLIAALLLVMMSETFSVKNTRIRSHFLQDW